MAESVLFLIRVGFVKVSCVGLESVKACLKVRVFFADSYKLSDLIALFAVDKRVLTMTCVHCVNPRKLWDGAQRRSN